MPWHTGTSKRWMNAVYGFSKGFLLSCIFARWTRSLLEFPFLLSSVYFLTPSWIEPRLFPKFGQIFKIDPQIKFGRVMRKIRSSFDNQVAIFLPTINTSNFWRFIETISIYTMAGNADSFVFSYQASKFGILSKSIQMHEISLEIGGLGHKTGSHKNLFIEKLINIAKHQSRLFSIAVQGRSSWWASPRLLRGLSKAIQTKGLSSEINPYHLSSLSTCLTKIKAIDFLLSNLAMNSIQRDIRLRRLVASSISVTAVFGTMMWTSC